MIRAGDLHHRVTIQAETGTAQSDTGEPIEVWSDVLTVWCDIQRPGGRELMTAGQVVEDAPIVVRMRYYPWLTAKHRLVGDDGTIYEISSVNDPDSRHRELALSCSTRK